MIPVVVSVMTKTTDSLVYMSVVRPEVWRINQSCYVTSLVFSYMRGTVRPCTSFEV